MKMNMISPRTSLPALVLCLSALACSDDGGSEGEDEDVGETEAGETDTGEEGRAVELSFAAAVAGEPAACGTTYEGVGSSASAVEIQDLRFFVSEIELLDAEGSATALTLEQDGLWQYENIALLDFEDGTSACADAGTTEINDTVVGTVPEGDYVGLRFVLGVPFEYNHLDVDLAPSPLNVASMFWAWQSGYKFARVDLRVGDEGDAWFWHQGSTGCESGASEEAPSDACARSNRLSVEFADFDPASQRVVFDVGALLSNIDLTTDGGGAPGCMSGVDDPECTPLFTELGLDLTTGTCVSDCSDQALFHVE
ncbi:metallo-mystery pair system four-Cys motif protein [Pseudenhygromyxa sp. WMMC2535]|uniref:MbnP family copper-binding protein n=1 Tax=Pseudenhygromyxa sp. WMMC2535 TaxID=2712867 RepID=UPI0015567BC8|nr:MbnP family copper-binding protein [Pseudenhygromyxa sp. WMMC2535]NVB37491.1 metallo-mystery pair system four-Cys motif protein [Pseudenhygromyxa sp. WMMC2535]